MSTDKKNTEEEVDLGSLFIIIGKGFSKFFNFIGSIFKGLFHLLILLLLFVKKHFIKFAIAAVVGGGVGSFFEFTKPDRYGADLLLQPNFNSTRQLYNNINYYNDLVKQNDSVLLAETFNIDVSKAASLKKFEIEPVVNNNDIIESYNNLILSVDTLTSKSYSLDEFKRVFTPYDYQVHKVHVEALDKGVFGNLDDVIVSSITKNKYFNKVKELTNENLNRTDSILKISQTQIDSLRKVYVDVMLKEASKTNSGTSIDLGGEKRTTKELELFQTNRSINNDLKRIAQDISEKSEVVNVISNFQSVGYEIKGIKKNYIFLGATLFVVLALILVVLKELNVYLNNYNVK